MGVPYAEVIGDPIAQSKSPLIHTFWLNKLGIEGDYRRTRVAAHELPKHFEDRGDDPDWRGVSVTAPHKTMLGPLLDRVDPIAERIGAVNLVAREKDGLVGYNSDASGFLESIRGLLDRSHLFRMARILGTGGAARAVAHALWAQGFTLVIIGRDPAKAEALRSEFDPAHSYVGALADFATPTDFIFDDRQGILDLVINATPLGMAGQPPLDVDFSHIPPGAVVYDLVYAPLETQFLYEARARGHRTIDGLGMLVGQAAIAFEKLFGRPAPREHDAELRELLTR